MFVNQQAHKRISAVLAAFMALHGYEYADTPTIEPAELFLTKAGDQIVEKLITFERYGHQLALRPEFTAGAAHCYLKQDRAVVRWQFNGPVFEDDLLDSSRNYQGHSAGAELIGLSGVYADAEVIALAANGLAALSIKDWRVVIGHVGLMRRLLGRYQIDARTQRFLLHHRALLRQGAAGKRQVLEELDLYFLPTHFTDQITKGTDGSLAEVNTHQILDVLLDASNRGETMGGRTQHDIARRLLHKRKQSMEKTQVVAALDFLADWIVMSGNPDDVLTQIEKYIGPNDAIGQEILDDWRSLVRLLAMQGITPDRIIIQPDLARTWDYYTGIVFELHSEDIHLGGGGRYDELTRLIGGQRDVPAVGFAYYLDHFATLLPESDGRANQIVIYTGDATYFTAVKVANDLRQRGLSVVITVDASDKHDLQVLADNQVQFGEKAYNLEQLDTLVEELRRTANYVR